jgi:hypothetical protein
MITHSKEKRETLNLESDYWPQGIDLIYGDNKTKEGANQ